MTKLTLHVQFERECLSYKYCKLPRVVNLGLHYVLLGKQSLLKRFGKRMRICSDSDPQLRMQTSSLSVWYKNHQLFSATFFRIILAFHVHPCFSCSNFVVKVDPWWTIGSACLAQLGTWSSRTRESSLCRISNRLLISFVDGWMDGWMDGWWIDWSLKMFCLG